VDAADLEMGEFGAAQFGGFSSAASWAGDEMHLDAFGRWARTPPGAPLG